MKGLVDVVTSSEISGWLESPLSLDSIDIVLTINGDPSSESAIFSDIQKEDTGDSQLYKCRFSFRMHEGVHQLKSCVVEVRTASGDVIPPGSIMFSPTQPRWKKMWNLHDIDGSVNELISSVSDVDLLQEQIALLSSWFGHALDRTNALRQHAEEKSTNIREMLSSTGHLRGALGHLIGVIQKDYPEITFPVHESASVSVIIPVHNNFALTYNCLKSIRQHMGKSSFEIILVDDLSSDETLLASLIFNGTVRTVRNARNLGFVGTCNAGAAIARGKYLFFLNNDTLVTDDFWLDQLVQTFSEADRAGIVGSRLRFEDGKLQECGGIVWQDGSAWNWGRESDPMSSAFRFRREVDYVSGAALMIPRQLFSELGGFDYHFAPAYYEDTDLCFRVRKAGYRVYVQPGSTITHLEGRSNGTDLTAGLKRYQTINLHKFVERWRSVLASYQPNGQHVDKAVSRYIAKTALFIDDSVLTPDQDAGSNAALQHILSLQRLGYKVVFIPSHNMADIPPYTQRLEWLGIECIYAPQYWSVEDYLRRSKATYDLVYLHRFSNAHKYLSIARTLLPQSKIIYNVADLHSLREEREAQLVRGPASAKKPKTIDPDRELDLTADADVTIVHSSYERDFIGERRPSANVHVIPWSFIAAQEVVGRVERRGIMFVGGFGHSPNVDAVLWYLQNVHPLVTKARPDCVFRIVGSKMPKEFLSFASETIEPVGYVEDVDDLLAHSIASVAPLRFGAGIKGKVLSSFSQGTPCIMSSIAAEGLELTADLSRFVSDDPEQMAAMIIKLIDDSSAWEKCCWAALDLIDELYSPDAIDRLIGSALGSN